ncbi:type II toxin-antitoxin system RelE/ParE family toxin [Janthinobacterium sp. HLX7-2]|uniref:type II toxin-antitoxin system RelE/ParE family toxin n=1 Tax=Janthinobacterium sp. HLX7-2 TaxID=1259331 RepID=UPI003F29D7EA
MTRKIVVLDSAKEEFKDIKKYVKTKFGDASWYKANAEYKDSIQEIKRNPHIGSYIDELKEIGITNVKYTLVHQTKIVYEFDDDLILIHMFINTKRDFRTHLFKRLFSQ